MSVPHVGISWIEGMPSDAIDAFSDDIQHVLLEIRRESREQESPFAGFEWLIPTAVVVFIGKAYFESFLKEAGKDHYDILKKALAKLTAKFTGSQAPQARLYFSEGKAISPIPKYSLVYSVLAELGGGYSAKLLIQSDLTPEDCNLAVDRFLEFIESLHAGKVEAHLVTGLEGARPVGRMLLVAWNRDSKKLEVIDPSPKRTA